MIFNFSLRTIYSTLPVSSIVLLVLTLSSHRGFSQGNNNETPRDLGSLGDVSWGFLEIEVQGQPEIGTFFPIQVDTAIALYDSRGNVLLENDNIFFGNLDSKITWRNPVAGQYYLAVALSSTIFKAPFTITTTSTNSGDFLLLPSRETPPPGDPTFSPIIPGTVPARGVVWYKFTISDRLNDTDGDGIFNSVEDQFDCLDKNVADADNDPDGDGLSNITELNLGTHPCNPDSDRDGLTDGEEVNRVVLGQPAPTNPLDDDTDTDGLSDGFETGTGIVKGMTDSGTDPLLADTDGDAVEDLKELQIGTDPFNPDTDGDGSTDGDEIASQTDPLDGLRSSGYQAKLMTIEHKSRNISITWETTASVDYQLQKSTNLQQWENVGSPAVATSDAFTYSQASTNGLEFFRLKSVPAPYLDGKSPLHALSLGSVPAGGLYVDTAGSAVADTIMACYDSNGNFLFLNDDMSDLIRWSMLSAFFPPGTYYIATGKFPFRFRGGEIEPFTVTGIVGVTDEITVNVTGENIAAGILKSASGVNSSGVLWFSLIVE